MARRRRGRFSPQIRRYGPPEFRKSLDLFVDALDSRPEDFKPAGLPGFVAMQQRCAIHPDFAVLFAGARRARIEKLCEAGIGRRAGSKGYEPEHFDAWLVALARSECPHKSAFAEQGVEGLPTWGAIKHRAARDPEFRKRLNAALVAKGWDKESRPPASAFRTQFPSRYRKNEADDKAKVLEALRSTVTIVHLRRDWRELELPSRDRVERWRSIDADFAAELQAITSSDGYKARVLKARGFTPRAPKRIFEVGQLRGRLLQETLYQAADKAVDRRFKDRDDVIADLIEAALEGSIEIDDMEDCADEFITAHNRRAEAYKFRSLNQRLSDDSDTEVGDLVTADSMGYGDYAD